MLRTSLRWPVLVCACLAAAGYLNSAFYSAWVSSGPPTEFPEAWAHRSLAHACYAGACLLVGLAVFRGLRLYPRVSRLSVVLGFVSLLLTGLPSVRAFLDQDACLDAGGRWHRIAHRCETQAEADVGGSVQGARGYAFSSQ